MTTVEELRKEFKEAVENALDKYTFICKDRPINKELKEELFEKIDKMKPEELEEYKEIDLNNLYLGYWDSISAKVFEGHDYVGVTFYTAYGGPTYYFSVYFRTDNPNDIIIDLTENGCELDLDQMIEIDTIVEDARNILRKIMEKFIEELE